MATTQAILKNVPSQPMKSKKLLERMHAILRDFDGDSIIMHRFDELTKIIVVHTIAAKNRNFISTPEAGESLRKYALRFRNEYKRICAENPILFPKKYSALKASEDSIYNLGLLFDKEVLAHGNPQLLGYLYEEMIAFTFDKNENQQFFTPQPVVDFMRKLTEPYLKGRVCDPACGTGGFLTAFGKDSKDEIEIRGFEIDERLGWIANINLFLHDYKKFDVTAIPKYGIFSSDIDSQFETFDLILTNPPFGSEITDKTVLRKFELGKSFNSRRRGILFLERCWQLLKSNGVLAIILDESVLNAPASKDVRRFILDNFQIKSVISLPESTFQPYANVKTSILLLQKARKSKKFDTFFANVERNGRRPNGDDDIHFNADGSSEARSDFPTVLKLYKTKGSQGSKADLDTYWSDIRENIDDEIRLDFFFHHPMRISALMQIQDSADEFISLSEICDDINIRVTPSEVLSEEIILYTGLANIEVGTGIMEQEPIPGAAIKSSVKQFMPQDILFSKMRPRLRKVAIHQGVSPGFASPECTVLRVKLDQGGAPLVPPEALAALLRSDFIFSQLLYLVTGIGRPRLSSKDLLEVKIPKADLKKWESAKEAYESKISEMKKLVDEAERLKEAATKLQNLALSEIADALLESS